MISIKKIMSVIAIAFAVMTIAGSGVTSFASASALPDTCAGSAATLPGCSGTGLFGTFFKTEPGASTLNTAIGSIGTILIGIIASVSVLFLILGAFDMITDSGDGKKFANGKARITNAIIGLVVAALSFAIVRLVLSVIK
jgi:hypothetical protein